jgi:diguanylate cyclase (GGDEF)-like protein/PAS domain S-box-containing protein
MSSKIFVVEDDALTAEQLQLYIMEMGYQFAGAAKSAEAALTQIRQCQPDLVLMDIRLKGEMDGIEVAAKLKAESGSAVIYLSAYAEDALLARAKLTEPLAYLLKPFSKQELKVSIEMGLYKRQLDTERKHAGQELETMHQLLDDIQKISRLGGWKYDCKTRRITWTDGLYRIYGVNKDYDPNSANSAFYSAEDAATLAQAFEKSISIGEPYDLAVRLFRPDGECIWVRTIARPVIDNGKVSSVTGNVIDITESRLAEEKIRAQEEFFRMIAENVKDFIAVLDLEGRRLYNSPSYARLFGSIDALKGTDSFAEIHPDDRERIKALFKNTVQSGIGQRTEYRFMLANGSIRQMESCGGLIRDCQGKAQRVVVVSHDITSRKQADQEIHHLAFYDRLTQLPNRCMLSERLDLSMAAGKRSGRYGAILFLDLNNFKPLNDLCGHSAGDLLLIQVAKRLKSCMRETDTVARFGGDEFVMILGELNADKDQSRIEACMVAEKIRSILAEPYLLDICQAGKAPTTIEHHCTTSIGVALFLDHQASQDDLIKWADMAMYQAKEAGRNQIRFYAAEKPGSDPGFP